MRRRRCKDDRSWSCKGPTTLTSRPMPPLRWLPRPPVRLTCGSCTVPATGCEQILGWWPPWLGGWSASAEAGAQLTEGVIDGVAQLLGRFFWAAGRGEISGPPRSVELRPRPDPAPSQAMTAPVTKTGTDDLAVASADVPQAGARPSRLGRSGHDRTGRDVVDRLVLGALEVARSWVERPTMAWSPKMRRAKRGGSVVLAHVDAVGSDRQGQIRTIVHNERHPEVVAHRLGQLGPSQQRLGVQLLVSRSWTTSTPPAMQSARNWARSGRSGVHR